MENTIKMDKILKLESTLKIEKANPSQTPPKELDYASTSSSQGSEDKNISKNI